MTSDLDLANKNSDSSDCSVKLSGFQKELSDTTSNIQVIERSLYIMCIYIYIHILLYSIFMQDVLLIIFLVIQFRIEYFEIT